LTSLIAKVMALDGKVVQAYRINGGSGGELESVKLIWYRLFGIHTCCYYVVDVCWRFKPIFKFYFPILGNDPI